MSEQQWKLLLITEVSFFGLLLVQETQSCNVAPHVCCCGVGAAGRLEGRHNVDVDKLRETFSTLQDPHYFPHSC